MQYTITINQAKALEWGLNAQQALLFAFVYECPSWARPTKREDGVFYALSKAKVLEELPLLTDKPDTVYRLLKQLDASGLIQLSSTPHVTLIRLTRKGREWNRKVDGSEKYPTHQESGKISEVGNSSEVGGYSEQDPISGSENNPTQVGEISETDRKKIREGSEKSPTNQGTSNQDTNQGESTARGTRLPRDWVLPGEYLGWALENLPGLGEPQIRASADRFRDYWHARAGAAARKADWFATWRNWVRGDAERRGLSQPAGNSSSWADDLGVL
ncbi:hypothetical protein [Pseudomonas sp. RIT-PI-AD]|uniref:hypothetical protein n=1 Tax=Pseudomonas sp. RIT-PI-AD TaxID=3035294 RepID=UPI0021D9F0E6|nr:hypothetical protein [Pseudomonas sp. RIT-PI-AD]